MTSTELAASLKHECKLWMDDIIPDTVFEERVLTSLSELDAESYDVVELLGEKAIALLLTHGEQRLKNEATGGMWMISDGRVVDTSHLAPMYRNLFAQWTRRGWIEMPDANTVVRRQI